MTPKEKRRDGHLRRTYGITTLQYDDLLGKQNHKCAICWRPSSSFKRSLAVDHCHTTLRVRGLLCPFCNRGLRYYRDDPEAMERAAQYLRQGTEFFAPPKKRKRRSKAKTNSRRTSKTRAAKKGRR